MLALVLAAAVPVPDVARLGSESWAEREAEQRRCDNPLSALLLPPRHPDPEIDARVRLLRTRNLRHFDARYVEGLRFRAEFPRWVDEYLVTGRTRRDEYETFLEIHADGDKATAVFRVWPAVGGYEGFLRGAVWPCEFARWREHCDYHLRRAPPPREKP